MNDNPILVLCPSNMTAPLNGPEGFLGDRIHQLPAVIVATQHYSNVYVWPEDPITRGLFNSLPITFIQGKQPEEVIAGTSGLGITKAICLHADPSSCDSIPNNACENVRISHEIARNLSPDNYLFAANLDPRGRVPNWRRLVETAWPDAAHELEWPSPPFLIPTDEAKAWASDLMAQAAGKPIIIASPLSGGDKNTVEDDWWRELAEIFSQGFIFVPVYGDMEITKANGIFGDSSNVKIFNANIDQTVALAAAKGVHVLGIDGGRMNVLAAASPRGALVIYGDWPATAWAMPNVIARDPDITPEEALVTVP